MLRSLLLFLSRADWAKSIVTNFPPAMATVRRFVAGETIEEGIEPVRRLNAKGLLATLDHLGENVFAEGDAAETTQAYLALLDTISASDLAPTSISVKLPALGLDISDETCTDNTRQIAARARSHNIDVTIDMESVDYTDRTLDIFRRLRFEEGFENLGTVIQAYLYRSEEDMRSLAAEGARVRLCKGAYKEPGTVAFPEKRQVDDNFAYLTGLFLNPEAIAAGAYLEVATHDARMVEAARYHAQRHGITPGQFEFQMLHGVRSGLQEQLAAEGYRVRVYVPYGTQWYPYFMRRLAERPANVWFFASNYFKR
jgi:proline dehydrogenase